MKHLALLFTLCLVFGCSESENQMHLTGQIEGLKKGTLLLQKQVDTSLVTIDSLVVDGSSQFEFTAEVTSPEIYFLYLRLNNGTLLENRIPFFAEASEITILTSLNKFGSTVEITGSENQKRLDTYRKLIGRYSNKNLELVQQQLEARRDGEDSLAAAIEIEKNKIISSMYLATVNFAVNEHDREVAPYLMLSEVYDANIKYLDTVYNALTPDIKASKYGEELERYIAARKEQTNQD